MLAIAKRFTVPGPGAYDSVKLLKPDGRYFVSQFKDSGANALRSTARRFPDKTTNSVVPGPGRYESLQALCEKGQYFVSRFGSSLCRKFDNSHRNFALDPPGGTPARD